MRPSLGHIAGYVFVEFTLIKGRLGPTLRWKSVQHQLREPALTMSDLRNLEAEVVTQFRVRELHPLPGAWKSMKLDDALQQTQPRGRVEVHAD